MNNIESYIAARLRLLIDIAEEDELCGRQSLGTLQATETPPEARGDRHLWGYPIGVASGGKTLSNDSFIDIKGES